MKFKNLIFSLILIMILTACGKNEQQAQNPGEIPTDLTKYNEVIYDYFDTVTTFLAYAEDDKEYEKYKEVLYVDLKKYHEFYNTYHDFEGINNVRTINEMAGIEPVKVDPEIIELIEYSKEIYDISDGKLNIALGNLLELWHKYREVAIANPADASVPSQAELEESKRYIDIDKIVIDKANSTVFITDPNIQIDIGAVGKGYAIEKIANHLREAGLKHGILSIGGDDVIIGTNPIKADGLWKIAIQNPDMTAEDPYSSIIGLIDTTVVTSGDYQRFYKVDGEVYHHIIDPETMFPSKYFKSVSVVHPDIALADALSTYLFIINLEEGVAIAEEYGAEVLWVDKEDNYYKTPGWEELED